MILSFCPQIYDESETDQISNAKYYVWKNCTLGKWGLREAFNQNSFMQLFNGDRRIVQCLIELILGVGQCVCPPWFTKEKRACQTCLGLPERRYPPILMVMNIRLKIPSWSHSSYGVSIKLSVDKIIQFFNWWCLWSRKICSMMRSKSHLPQGNWFLERNAKFPIFGYY